VSAMAKDVNKSRRVSHIFCESQSITLCLQTCNMTKL